MEQKRKKLLALPPSDGTDPAIMGKFTLNKAYCRRIE